MELAARYTWSIQKKEGTKREMKTLLLEVKRNKTTKNRAS
jgi:hypothetical protein